MMADQFQKTIFTIGHSTRSMEKFIILLKWFDISVLADIRQYPESRRYPHFNKESLKISLEKVDIHYTHFIALGGRKKPFPDSTNTVWRNAAFRGYADYMETTEFKSAITVMEELATQRRTSYMCSEAVWWRCHRSLISDYLKIRGWKVMHISDVTKATEPSFHFGCASRAGKFVLWTEMSQAVFYPVY